MITATGATCAALRPAPGNASSRRPYQTIVGDGGGYDGEFGSIERADERLVRRIDRDRQHDAEQEAEYGIDPGFDKTLGAPTACAAYRVARCAADDSFASAVAVLGTPSPMRHYRPFPQDPAERPSLIRCASCPDFPSMGPPFRHTCTRDDYISIIPTA